MIRNPSSRAVALGLRTWFSLLFLGLCSVSFGQTAVTGSINGSVSDSTGAVVPNATVTIKDTATGDTRVLTTNAEGRFVSSFMKPDRVTVSATAPALQSTTVSVQVLVGQQSAVNLIIFPASTQQVVTVTANDVQLIETQTANLTTSFTTKEVQDLPAPGGDITTIAYTVPGVVANNGGEFGNFSSNGLPGLSNLFIINGADHNDPYLSLNSSGPSNLTLGLQEIAQASIVQNGYSVQYGRQAGAILTYTTKAGENRVHGLLQYNYNSSGLNANDFFNNEFGTPKSKAVSNQYDAQIGGPILRDKLFFFADTEGLRYILPVSGFVNFPTAQLQNTILNTVTPQSAALYGQMFNLLKSAPSYASATPVTNGPGGLQDANNLMGCGSIAGQPVFGQAGTYFGIVPSGVSGAAIPCVNASQTSATALNSEYEIAARFDYNISDRQKVFIRVTDDQGRQAASTNLISPSLDTITIPPEWTGQLNHTLILTPNLTNQFIMSGLYYSAVFEPVNIAQTLAASPVVFREQTDAGDNSSSGFGYNGSIGIDASPNGRNVSEYQFVDDVSWLKGNHNLKAGFNFERVDITDTVNRASTLTGRYTFGNAADFASGALPGADHSTYLQNFAQIPSAYTALYNVGIYAQDEWKASRHLVLDYGVRIDRDGNPLCNDHCFSEYVGGFPAAGVTLDTPYNQTLRTNVDHAFPSIEKAIFEPRAGFNWDTDGKGKTVLRGGVGLFADEIPAFVLSSEYGSFPSVFAPLVQAGLVAQGTGSAAANASAANSTVTAGFSKGLNATQIAASLPAGVPFSPPSNFTTPQLFVSPRYVEYSLQLQRQLTRSDALVVSYAGNHGYNLLISNPLLNQSLAGTGYASFGGLPAAQADPRFAGVSRLTNNAVSNYNGLSAQYKHIDSRGLTVGLSYTWSHALDDISNGGAGEAYNSGSILNQITPNSSSVLMYSNADYDIRNNLTANLTYVDPYHFHNRAAGLAADGWTVAAKAYWRSGEPFSVVNTDAENNLNNGTVQSPVVLAEVLNNNFNHHCTSFSNPCFKTAGIFNGSGTQDTFGNVPRNSFFGPHYADVDLSMYKNLIRKETLQFQLGAQAYNVLNHVNFGQPGNNASNPGSLGVISTDITAPTSPYGEFEGSSVSGRVLVVEGRLIF
jgi:hypothetical protein